MNEKPAKPGKGMESQQSRRTKPAKLDRAVQARVGRHLRAMYADVVDQGVPDRFAELLSQLDNGKKDEA